MELMSFKRKMTVRDSLVQEFIARNLSWTRRKFKKWKKFGKNQKKKEKVHSIFSVGSEAENLNDFLAIY